LRVMKNKCSLVDAFRRGVSHSVFFLLVMLIDIPKHTEMKW